MLLQEINVLRGIYNQSARILTHSFNGQQQANECSEVLKCKTSDTKNKNKTNKTNPSICIKLLNKVSEVK